MNSGCGQSGIAEPTSEVWGKTSAGLSPLEAQELLQLREDDNQLQMGLFSPDLSRDKLTRNEVVRKSLKPARGRDLFVRVLDWTSGKRRLSVSVPVEHGTEYTSRALAERAWDVAYPAGRYLTGRTGRETPDRIVQRSGAR